MKKRQSIHYVDNKALYTEMVRHISKYNEAIRNDEEPPKVSNYIAKALIQISEGLGSRGNFSQYPFLDEMKMDGIIDCLRYLHNFDPDKYNNPFAYFSRIMWQAFIRRIDKEKKLLYTKIKYAQSHTLFNPHLNDLVSENMQDKMKDMAERYEKK